MLNEHQIAFIKSLNYLEDEDVKSILDGDSRAALFLLDSDDYDTLWDIE
jgi:hypothetical protein